MDFDYNESASMPRRRRTPLARSGKRIACPVCGNEAFPTLPENLLPRFFFILFSDFSVVAHWPAWIISMLFVLLGGFTLGMYFLYDYLDRWLLLGTLVFLLFLILDLIWLDVTIERWHCKECNRFFYRKRS